MTSRRERMQMWVVERPSRALLIDFLASRFAWEPFDSVSQKDRAR